MDHLEDVIRQRAREDGAYAVAWALLQLGEQLHRVADAVENLDMNLTEAISPLKRDPDDD